MGGGRYLLIKLEKLHRHIALELGPGPAGKHPQSCDDHRVQHLKIQGDGRHIGGGEHRGVGHLHDLYLSILACNWDRGGVGLVHEQDGKK